MARFRRRRGRRRGGSSTIKTRKLISAAKTMIGFALGESILVNYPGTTTEIILLLLAFGPVPIPRGLGSVAMGMSFATSYAKSLYDAIYQNTQSLFPQGS